MNSNVLKSGYRKTIRKIRDKNRYSCPDCSKSFVRESAYKQHKCEPRRRKNETLNTIVGQKALIYYQTWMKFLKHPVMTPLDNFINSKSYTSLILFAKYAKQTGITNFQLFLHAMEKRGWLSWPMMWRYEDSYAEYIKYLDVQQTPSKRVVATLEYLEKVSEAADVDISNIFEVIEPGELITLIENRKLSLWFLLFSEKFYAYCDSASEEQRQIIENIIEDGGWNKKLADNPHLSQKFKKYAMEVGL